MSDVSWRRFFNAKTMSASNAVKYIPDVSTVFIGTGAGEPSYLVDEIASKAPQKKLEFIYGWSFRPVPYEHQLYKPRYFFVTKAQRKDSVAGKLKYTPSNIGDIPYLFRRKMKPDVAVIQVSPPDKHGYMSMGVSVDFTREAVKNASLVIAQVNQYMPRTHGDSFLTYNDIDIFVKHSEPLPEIIIDKKHDKIQTEIGRHLLNLIPEGATINSGLGKISSSVVRNLEHKNLKIHSLVISDWIMELYEKGNLCGDKQNTMNKITASHAVGSSKFYDFIDDSPMISMKTTEYIINPAVISSIDNFISIGAAFKMDLSGQMYAGNDTGGIYSSITNSVSFENLTTLSKGGKSILVMPSTDLNGESNITDYISRGSSVLKTMNNTDYVVTEYGIATLKGRCINERALSLVRVAHPDVRKELLSGLKSRRFFEVSETILSKPSFLQTINLKDEENNNISIKTLEILDFPKLNRFYERLSEQDKSRRFFGSKVEIDHYLLEKLQSENSFILAAIIENSEESIIGTAEISTNQNNNGDIAFTIGEKFRGKGFGKILFNALINFAKQIRVKKLTAEILKNNQPMIGLISKNNLTWNKEEKDDTVIFTAKLKD